MFHSFFDFNRAVPNFSVLDSEYSTCSIFEFEYSKKLQTPNSDKNEQNYRPNVCHTNTGQIYPCLGRCKSIQGPQCCLIISKLGESLCRLTQFELNLP